MTGGGPLWALVDRLERLEAEARAEARRSPDARGMAGAMREAAAYRNAAAQVADVAKGGEG